MSKAQEILNEYCPCKHCICKEECDEEAPDADYNECECAYDDVMKEKKRVEKKFNIKLDLPPDLHDFGDDLNG